GAARGGNQTARRRGEIAAGCDVDQAAGRVLVQKLRLQLTLDEDRSSGGDDDLAGAAVARHVDLAPLADLEVAGQIDVQERPARAVEAPDAVDQRVHDEVTGADARRADVDVVH